MLKHPNYSILQYTERHQSAEGHHPLTVEDLFSIMTRFDQPSFKAQFFLEQVLLKEIQGHDSTVEISEIKNIYGDDINSNSLPTELQLLKTIVKEQKPLSTCAIVKMLKNYDGEN